MKIALTVQRRDEGETSPDTGERVFAGPIISIGSDASATLCLDDARVAAEQAVILLVEDDAPLLISRAPGTILNGERLAPETRRPLSGGDRIVLGKYVLIFRAHDAPPGAQSPENTARPRMASAAPKLSFEQLLNELRTVEDSFYFEITGGGQDGARLPLEGASVEALIGYAESEIITLDAGRVTTPCALVRKDWSGVIIEPVPASRVRVNRESLTGPRRLRGGDRVAFGGRPEVQLVFHEPAALTVLETILERRPLPPPISPSTGETTRPAPDTPPEERETAPPREYFGAFTLFELGLMIAGTLAGAAIIFLLLSAS